MIEEPEHRARTRAYRRAVHSLVSMGVVVLIFVLAIPAIADYGEVWMTITGMPPAGFGLLVLVSLVSISTYWWVLEAAMPGLSIPRAGLVHQASTAVANTLPGGGAIGIGVSFAMYRSWGFSPGEIARAVLVSGIWDAAVKLSLPIAALGLLVAAGDASPGLMAAAAGGFLVFGVVAAGSALVLRSDRLARWLGRNLQGGVSHALTWFNRKPVTGWDDRLSRLRASSLEVIRGRWARLTIAVAASHLALFSVLLASLRVVGVTAESVAFVEVFGAFAFVRLIQVLPITPGGAGLVELGYAAVLSGGLSEQVSARVVAAVLVFRFLTFALPIVFGGAAWIIWRVQGNPSPGVDPAAHEEGSPTP